MFSMLFQHVVSASTAPNISKTIAQKATPPEKTKKNEAHCNRPSSDVPADPGGVSGRRPSGLRLSSPPGQGQGPATSDGTSYIIHGDVICCVSYMGIYGFIRVYKGYIYIYMV